MAMWITRVDMTSMEELTARRALHMAYIHMKYGAIGSPACKHSKHTILLTICLGSKSVVSDYDKNNHDYDKSDYDYDRNDYDYHKN